MENKLNRSIFLLIIVNLITLIGVLFFGWSLYQIMYLFWFENIVIGFYNLLKMRKVSTYQRSKPELKKQAQGALFLIIFFMFHFGIFTAVHGVFVNVMFNDGTIRFWGMLVVIFSLFVSHGLSFKQNFIEKQEYKNTNIQKLFFAPYKRIFIMHLTILLGGWAVLLLGQPVGALLVLIGLKISLDYFSHKFEHKKLLVKN